MRFVPSSCFLLLIFLGANAQNPFYEGAIIDNKYAQKYINFNIGYNYQNGVDFDLLFSQRIKKSKFAYQLGVINSNEFYNLYTDVRASNIVFMANAGMNYMLYDLFFPFPLNINLGLAFNYGHETCAKLNYNNTFLGCNFTPKLEFSLNQTLSICLSHRLLWVENSTFGNIKNATMVGIILKPIPSY